jgi:hypothetical protein
LFWSIKHSVPGEEGLRILFLPLSNHQDAPTSLIK